MEPLINYDFVAANVYFVGTCNLQCKYCFQPKIGKKMSDVNEKIIEWVKSGKMEEDVEKHIGKDIECLALWGGEPSINLPYLTERLDKVYERFPKLNSISYSTNMSKRHLAQNSVDFIKAVLEMNRKYRRSVKVDLQISIDGPPEVNDKDRIGCKAEEILGNTTFVLESLKDIPRSERCFNIHGKGTHSAETMKWFLQPHEKYETNLEYHFRYFDDWHEKWGKICDFWPTFGGLTLVYPGHYTQEDGYNYLRINQLLLEELPKKEWKFKPDFISQTALRAIKAFETLKRGVRKEYKYEMLSNCTCSAGRSCAGISYDGKYHWCQSTYFFDDEVLKHLRDNNLISDFEANQGFSFRNYENYVKNVEVVDYDNDLLMSRSLNMMHNFWTNLSTRTQYLEMQIRELASAGLVSKCYLDDRWVDLAVTYFLWGGNECPSDNVWEFGSPYIRDNSHIKLICNGTLEYILSRMDRNGELNI